jgi:hypothetical protein
MTENYCNPHLLVTYRTKQLLYRPTIRDRETNLPGKFHTRYYQYTETQQIVCISSPVFHVTTKLKQSPVFFFMFYSLFQLPASASRYVLNIAGRVVLTMFPHPVPLSINLGAQNYHIPHDDQFTRFTKFALCFAPFYFSLLCMFQLSTRTRRI